MSGHSDPTIFQSLTRREFLALGAGAAAAATTGCAINPVTGKSQLMLVSESTEIELDQQWSPHQFSSDYGAVQDKALNAYVTQLGTAMAPFTHRPGMPFNFRVLNAVAVNAYTFPGGSMGFNRGLLLQLESEAELAAVMGHEMGHVCARHMAQQQTSGMLTGLILTGIAAYVEYEFKDYGELAAGLGALGSYALLSRYSRDNEREADKLGMMYASRAGYTPRGMVGVMDKFRQLQKSKPGVVDLLFATHPMSDERYDTAVRRMQGEYAALTNAREDRERYMDKTAGLRRMGRTIGALQKGEALMVGSKPAQAQVEFQSALAESPSDYAALLMMAKCHLIQKKYGSALNYADQARKAYPEEPQASHICGMARMNARRFDAALKDFSDYEARLPGNPNTMFFLGYCCDQMGQRQSATRHYMQYIDNEPGGEYAEKARARLIEWGVLQNPSVPSPEPKPEPSPAPRATAKPTAKPVARRN